MSSKLENSSKKPKVSIVISTYNQDKLLMECLDSIKDKTSYKNYNVFLIDDSGTGKIAKIIRPKYSWVTILENEKNLGFSGSNNKGIKKALSTNPDYILLLNDDARIIQKNWLKDLIDIAEKRRDIGILGCKIVYPDKSLQNIGGYIKGWKILKELKENRIKPFEVDHVMGAFMLIKIAVIKKIGLLDEVFTPYLLEDTDYCLRAKKAEFKILSIPNISVIHHKGKSIDTKISKERIFIRLKNDIVFSRRHLRGFNKFFRLFILLPSFTLFRKKSDEGNIGIGNLRLREDFLRNFGLYFKAWSIVLKKGLK